MGVARGHLARLAVVVAVAAGALALGAWWSSLLVAKASGTLTAFERTAAAREVTGQLDRLSPGAGDSPQAQAAITRALEDPAVTQALAGSGPGGTQALQHDLGRYDSALVGLGNGALAVDAGQHALARLGHDLRTTATVAGFVAAALAAAGLLVSPEHLRTLRHLGVSTAVVAGLALLAGWLVPDLIGHATHGSAHDVALTIVHGGDPVRGALWWCLGAGALAVAGGAALELVGGAAPTGPQAPIARGRTV